MGWHHIADPGQHGRVVGLDALHAAKDIICYFLPLVPYGIGLRPLLGHLSCPWSSCNCHSLCY
jgi:hypothetical protein